MFTITSESGRWLPIDGRLWTNNRFMFRINRQPKDPSLIEGKIEFLTEESFATLLTTNTEFYSLFEQIAALTLGKSPGSYSLEKVIPGNRYVVQTMCLKGEGLERYLKPENFVLVHTKPTLNLLRTEPS